MAPPTPPPGGPGQHRVRGHYNSRTGWRSAHNRRSQGRSWRPSGRGAYLKARAAFEHRNQKPLAMVVGSVAVGEGLAAAAWGTTGMLMTTLSMAAVGGCWGTWYLFGGKTPRRQLRRARRRAWKGLTYRAGSPFRRLGRLRERFKKDDRPRTIDEIWDEWSKTSRKPTPQKRTPKKKSGGP